MSSDAVKGIASLLDSPVTQCKKRRTSHDLASPQGRSNEEACHSEKADQMRCCDRMGSSSEMKDKFSKTRYFIIKSLSHENIQLSVKKGIWATQLMNEPILEEAFQNSGKVILIFSVNMSGFFQGYARMMSPVGWRRDNIWSQGRGKNNPWGRSFEVKWLCLNDLPFQKTLHLKNPWNDFKPVKISRDCQELPGDIGEALCELLDVGNHIDVSLRRNEAPGVDFSARGPYTEAFHSIQDEDSNVPLMHMAPTRYPTLIYQHQCEAKRFHLPRQRADVLPDSTSIVHGPSKLNKSRQSHVNGNTANGMDNSSRIGILGLPSESGCLDGTLTEDDILEMTYEEYLEAHARGSRRLTRSATGTSMSMQKSSSSKERSDDSQSASSSKKRIYRQSLE